MSRIDLTVGEEQARPRLPQAGAVLQLLKPVTWFPPMWAFMCGAVSSGARFADHWPLVLAGVVLAGPAVCATSQATNDWFDRHVDAINEPDRPIPSGRIPGRWGLWIALAWTGLSVALGAALGTWVLCASVVGLVLSWAYSAPPFRLKESGWWGLICVALCYEGLAWFTGAAVLSGGLPSGHSLALAGLYSLGAVGIMILNDFKAIEGDRQTGVRSVPVRLGAEKAARVACLIMGAPQIVVAALLLLWGRPVYAGVIAVLILAQGALMARLLSDPRRFAPWYNATGVSLYVLGMLASGFALAAHVGG